MMEIKRSPIEEIAIELHDTQLFISETKVLVREAKLRLQPVKTLNMERRKQPMPQGKTPVHSRLTTAGETSDKV